MKVSKTRINWKVVYEVTFYGNNSTKGSFREIRRSSIVFNNKFKKKNMVSFDNKENVEINFLLWVDGLSIENLIDVPNDYYDENIRYDEESIEVIEVTMI